MLLLVVVWLGSADGKLVDLPLPTICEHFRQLLECYAYHEGNQPGKQWKGSNGNDKLILMRKTLRRLWKEDEGQDLVEYGLLIILVGLFLIASMQTVANAINTALYSRAASQLTST